MFFGEKTWKVKPKILQLRGDWMNQATQKIHNIPNAFWLVPSGQDYGLSSAATTKEKANRKTF